MKRNMKTKMIQMSSVAVLSFVLSGTVLSATLFGQCENAGSNADITNCLGTDYQKADAELNRIYKLAFTGLDEKAEQNLRKAQRAWIIYRDAQCDAEYAKWGGGSGGPRAHLECLSRLTQLRTRELHKTYRFQ
jgi:uncharacterized protein YecT (DUF1311 family)